MRDLKLNTLRKELVKDNKNRLNGVIEKINEAGTIEDLQQHAYTRQYFTKTTLKGGYFHDVKHAKNYLINRVEQKKAKRITEVLQNFDDVLNSGVLIEATISVSWTRSRMWGYNPQAEINYSYLDTAGQRRFNTVESSRVGGCGYCKLSTAVAEAINQVKPIKRSLYKKKNTNPTAKNNEFLGYGSGYGVLPTIEGGVGVSCYPSIFEAIGYKFKTIASGKMFDVFKIIKSK